MQGHATLREKLAPNLRKQLTDLSQETTEIKFTIMDKNLSKPTLKVIVTLK